LSRPRLPLPKATRNLACGSHMRQMVMAKN
jgi:hypothetical protein